MKVSIVRCTAVGFSAILLAVAAIHRTEALPFKISFCKFDLQKLFNAHSIRTPPGPPGLNGDADQSGNGNPTKFASLFPFFDKNASRALLADIDDYFRYDDFISSTKKSRSLSDLWAEKTQNSKGLLVFLMPAILNQLYLLSSMSSFLVDRLAQYLQPTMVFLACTLMQPVGVSFVRNLLFGSVALGALFMIKDTVCTGSLWTPLPRFVDDSYAVVTG